MRIPTTEPPNEVDESLREDEPWRYVRPRSRLSFGVEYSELWAYRDLALLLTARDIRLRYRQTALGITWSVLQPVVAMAAFSAIFGKAAGLPSGGVPYPVFVLTGLVIWLFVSSAVATAAESLVAHPDLVTRVWFPRVLAPTSAILALTVDMGVCLVVLGVAMAAYGVAPPLQALTLPVWLIGAVLLAIALGLLLSAATVFYRDVRYALAYAVQVWLFVTPVVFPSSLVHGGWSYVLALNPATGLINGMRWALLDAPSPGLPVAVSIASLALLLVAGVVYFGSVTGRLADRI